jgi:hypothetical protein
MSTHQSLGKEPDKPPLAPAMAAETRGVRVPRGRLSKEVAANGMLPTKALAKASRNAGSHAESEKILNHELA